MLASLGQIMEDADLHQTIAEHASDYFATTIGPFDPLYEDYKCYEAPREDWIIVSDASLLVTTRDFRYSKERMEKPRMKALLWKFFFSGAEVVSAILDEECWNTVALLLDSLQAEPCSVIHNSSTSTHVHVGIHVPGTQSLSPLDVNDDCTRVAAIWYIFETFINLLHPEHRVNEYCKRSRRSPLAKQCDQGEFVQKLQDSKTPRNIHQIMNNTEVVRRRGRETIVTSRYFGASFENVQSDKKFTIEFRSHEGTNDFGAIECWGKLLMRLFDQAVESDWEYIWSLVDLTDGLEDQKCYGPEKTRPVTEWRRWVQHMHYLFVNFLAGQEMRNKYLNDDDPGSLEAAILELEELVDLDDDSVDVEQRAKREEELLIKRLAIYMTNRRAKFKNLHEGRFSNFVRWDSEGRRDPQIDDFMDYPNPTGIVRDGVGRDIPINEFRPQPEEVDAVRAAPRRRPAR